MAQRLSAQGATAVSFWRYQRGNKELQSQEQSRSYLEAGAVAFFSHVWTCSSHKNKGGRLGEEATTLHTPTAAGVVPAPLLLNDTTQAEREHPPFPAPSNKLQQAPKEERSCSRDGRRGLRDGRRGLRAAAAAAQGSAHGAAAPLLPGTRALKPCRERPPGRPMPSRPRRRAAGDTEAPRGNAAPRCPPAAPGSLTGTHRRRTREGPDRRSGPQAGPRSPSCAARPTGRDLPPPTGLRFSPYRNADVTKQTPSRATGNRRLSSKSP